MKKEFMGFSWVGWLNILFLQFLGIRLYYFMSESPQCIKTTYGITGFIVPCTGWNGNYVPSIPWFVKNLFSTVRINNV